MGVQNSAHGEADMQNDRDDDDDDGGLDDLAAKDRNVADDDETEKHALRVEQARRVRAGPYAHFRRRA
jgi:hypothetical protein